MSGQSPESGRASLGDPGGNIPALYPGAASTPPLNSPLASTLGIAARPRTTSPGASPESAKRFSLENREGSVVGHARSLSPTSDSYKEHESLSMSWRGMDHRTLTPPPAVWSGLGQGNDDDMQALEPEGTGEDDSAEQGGGS